MIGGARTWARVDDALAAWSAGLPMAAHEAFEAAWREEAPSPRKDAFQGALDPGCEPREVGSGGSLPGTRSCGRRRSRSSPKPLTPSDPSHRSTSSRSSNRSRLLLERPKIALPSPSDAGPQVSCTCTALGRAPTGTKRRRSCLHYAPSECRPAPPR
ncbi:MAG: DUF309 domain-containing protein [Myxococcales bacterium]|nr:DUF309 domain-containing protein [Myxococcales bacterium]